MTQRLDILVSDTGPLVALAKLNLLAQLHHVFSRLYLPAAVVAEATLAGKPCAVDIAAFVHDHSAWVICPADASGQSIDVMSGRFGAGEVQAMHWAAQLGVPVLIDERRARAQAKFMGLQVVGLGAVLLRCKQVGILRLVVPAMKELEAMNYFLSPQVVQAIAALAGER